jgi:putative PIN family toxin of toxin-antitoxin system
MVYLQAAVHESGPAFACFGRVECGAVTLCISDEVLAEVRDVLTRPKLQAKFRRLTAEHVEAFLAAVRARAVTIAEVPHTFTYPRDPDDEPYLNLAIAAGARYLVSRDKDVLDLANDSDFRSRFPSLTILDPVAFLRELSKESQPEGSAEEGPSPTAE